MEILHFNSKCDSYNDTVFTIFVSNKWSPRTGLEIATISKPMRSSAFQTFMSEIWNKARCVNIAMKHNC